MSNVVRVVGRLLIIDFGLVNVSVGVAKTLRVGGLQLHPAVLGLDKILLIGGLLSHGDRLLGGHHVNRSSVLLGQPVSLVGFVGGALVEVAIHVDRSGVAEVVVVQLVGVATWNGEASILEGLGVSGVLHVVDIAVRYWRVLHVVEEGNLGDVAVVFVPLSVVGLRGGDIALSD